MAADTNIEWCDSTFNPWIGCMKVSPGCDHCYAERSTPARTMGIEWGAGTSRKRTSPANWAQPRRWEAQHQAFFAQHGRRQRVFCASLADVFDNEVPVQWRADLLQLIDLTPNLDWLILTKRIGNVLPMLRDIRRAAGGIVALDLWPRPNIWLGISVVNQDEADRDISKLLAVPSRVHFLSCEPLLGPVKLGPAWFKQGRTGVSGIDWVIVGGESGPKARPMHPDWARSLRDRCAAAGVPYLFKQWGEWISACQDDCPTGPPSSRWQWADGQPFAAGDGQRAVPLLWRAGKAAAGSLLDGIEHKAWPEDDC